VRTLELAHSRWAFRVDPDLRFDPRLDRVLAPVQDELERFRPDAIHITSPGDLGIAGAILAARLQVPLVLSWHTNLHEFAGRRVSRMAGWMGHRVSELAARTAERFVLDRVCWFFARGAAIFAPNPELASLLGARSGKPVFPMGRGIDTCLFHPQRRQRDDDALVLGYVGRLMPEKNLRLLAEVAAALRWSGVTNFRFQITGAGSERGWLEKNLPQSVFTGVLSGEPLARAYANMDVFLFPSRTDTFGNVVQEALASGVPAVVMDSGGPRFIVRDAASGFLAPDDAAFCRLATTLARDTERRRRMAVQARRQVEGQSWDRVFTEVYDGYARILQPV
jgi:glycosyltransferase involved in cell wall biosynthesis